MIPKEEARATIENKIEKKDTILVSLVDPAINQLKEIMVVTNK